MARPNPPSEFSESSTTGPAAFAKVITPADSDLDDVTRSIYIGGTGNLAVTMLGGGIVLFSAIPAGTVLPIRVSQIRSTLTTATLIVGMF